MLRLATKLLAIAMLTANTACSRLPPPWVPPAGEARPYRGMPTGLAFSSDGNRLAITFATARPAPVGPPFVAHHAGFVIVDAQDLRTVAVQDATPGSIQAVALSDDGRRLLALWRCHGGARGSGNCDEDGVFEHRVGEPGRILLLRESRDPGMRLHAVSYDGTGRAVALAAQVCRYIHGMGGQCSDYRLLAADHQDATAPRELGSWPVHFATSAPPQLGRDGTVRLYGNGSEMLLRVGEAARILRSGERWLGLVGRHSAVGAGGRVVVAAETMDLSEPRPKDRLVLVRPGPGATSSMLPATEFDADIGHVAMSAGGARAAFIATPLEGTDPQPALHIVDLADSGSPVVRRTDILARQGLGRTMHATRMTTEELLARLRALRDARRLSDVEAVGATLGLRPILGLPLTDGHAWHFVGELSPAGQEVRLALRADGSTVGQSVARLDMSLGGTAGPCLTTEAVARVFGEPIKIDPPYTAPPDWPPRQPRWSMAYQTAGTSVGVSFGRGYCASALSLSHAFRR